MTIRVVLVDDNDLVRQSLAAGFATQDDIDVVGEAVDGEAAVALARSVNSDVIVMDVHMPNLSGLAATEQLRSLGIETPVLILTADPLAPAAAACLSHVDCMLKANTTWRDVVSAVRAAVVG